MLFILYKSNHHNLQYHDGQEPIVHLVANFYESVEWAKNNSLRWVYTDTNAGTDYFNDYADFNNLSVLDWKAIKATQWQDRDIKEKKQAEFLMEHRFPCELIKWIGVYSSKQKYQVMNILESVNQIKTVKVKPDWYYPNEEVFS